MLVTDAQAGNIGDRFITASRLHPVVAVAQTAPTPERDDLMSALTRSRTRVEPHPYVHKLRMEARDGAAIELQPAAPLTYAGPRIVAKLVGASLAAATLLALLGLGLLA